MEPALGKGLRTARGMASGGPGAQPSPSQPPPGRATELRAVWGCGDSCWAPGGAGAPTTTSASRLPSCLLRGSGRPCGVFKCLGFMFIRTAGAVSGGSPPPPHPLLLRTYPNPPSSVCSSPGVSGWGVPDLCFPQAPQPRCTHSHCAPALTPGRGPIARSAEHTRW